jgi:cysteinyl-tRNA synthetase
MSEKYLGKYFDIHCGGEDHITVHHTNEIAQTQACHGTRLANFWMHGYFLQLDDSRMAKSSGDFLRLQVLIDRGYDPLAYRFYDLSAVYRVKLNFSWDGLDSAAKSLVRLRNMVYSWGVPGTIDQTFAEQFKEQINDDLNFPKAVALTWELARSALPDAVKKATILLFDQVLGLRLGDWQPVEEAIPDEIQKLAANRQQMRREKRWSEADAIRQQIGEAGYEVEDTAQGPKIKSRKTPAIT